MPRLDSLLSTPPRRRTVATPPPRLRIDTRALATPAEELENEDSAWTVSYLDVLLLLLTLFAVLLGTTWLRVAQSPAPVLPAPTTSVETVLKVRPAPPHLDQEIILAALQTLTLSALITTPPAPKPAPPAAPAVTAPLGLPMSDLEQLARRLAESTQGHLEVVMEARRIRLEVRDDILFPRASADLGAAGQALLDEMAARLRATTLEVAVEGHTDNIPIATDRFPSNWELSSFRATRVARYLISQGVAEEQVRVTGYADTRPRVPNDTPAHQAQNRRVSIVLQLAPVAIEGAPASPKPGENVQSI